MTERDFTKLAVTNRDCSDKRPDDEQQNRYLLAAYLLFALGFFVWFLPVAGVVLAYVKQDDVRGTVYESHCRFLISTFWRTLVISMIGIILCFIFVGFAVLFVLSIWYIVRIVGGMVRFFDRRPVTTSGWGI